LKNNNKREVIEIKIGENIPDPTMQVLSEAINYVERKYRSIFGLSDVAMALNLRFNSDKHCMMSDERSKMDHHHTFATKFIILVKEKLITTEFPLIDLEYKNPGFLVRVKESDALRGFMHEKELHSLMVILKVLNDVIETSTKLTGK
jgi:hypothetical protein